jgi:MHS family proline/betaine transporter-like MFS transporter
MAETRDVASKQKDLRSIIAGAYGNAIEWFDFALYGYFASVISNLFFPSDDKIASYLATFGVFAIGFVVRPIGGALFGHIGDRFGRRRALLFSGVIMCVPTALLGLLPTYQSVGVWAPVLLIVVRLVQGLAVGGEFTSSIAYLAEYAPPKRRGLFGSWSMTSCFLGILFGSAMAALVTSVLSDEALHSWGWRVPFLMALVLGVIGFLLRKSMDESPAFLEAKQACELVTNPVTLTLKTQKKNLLKVIGLLWVNAVCQYYLFVFFTTYIHHFSGLSLASTLVIGTICMAFVTLCLPVFGWLSDNVGRRPVLIGGSLGFLVFSIPLMKLMGGGDYTMVLVGELAFCLFVAARSGPVPATLVEVFPTQVRLTALSIGYNVNFAIFGGTAPLLATWLISMTGEKTSPAWYLMAVAAISIGISLLMPETRDRELTSGTAKNSA